jgi:hypothetical protein
MAVEIGETGVHQVISGGPRRSYWRTGGIPKRTGSRLPMLGPLVPSEAVVNVLLVIGSTGLESGLRGADYDL